VLALAAGVSMSTAEAKPRHHAKTFAKAKSGKGGRARRQAGGKGKVAKSRKRSRR